MNQARESSLFSAEGALLTGPAEIELALAEMWNVGGEETAGPDGAGVATRVSVANLIVVAPAAQRDFVLETLAELSPMYPTRTLVCLIADEPAEAPEITASVSAVCHVPQESQPQVCCEQVFIRCGPQHVPDLDHTLLPLLESDVPVMCWWRYHPRACPELFNALKAIARRIVLDEGAIVEFPAEPSARCAVRDIGWYQTAGLRELLAQLFDGCGPEVARSIQRVDIDTGGSLHGETEGFWLAAFLAGQLGWRPSSAQAIHEPDGSACGGCYRFLSGNRTVDVRITTHPEGGPRLRHVIVVSGDSTFELGYHPTVENEYRMTTCSSGICQMPRSVQVSGRRASQALAAALVGRPVDLAFERAQPIAAWLAYGAWRHKNGP